MIESGLFIQVGWPNTDRRGSKKTKLELKLSKMISTLL